MSSVVVLRLLAIFAVIGLGWFAGRTKLLGDGSDTARVMSNAAFYLFTPALLFRTTARIDLAALPWATLAAFFGPVVALLLAVYLRERRRGRLEPAGPAVRAISVSFGNTVQLGIPIVTALFGEAGLALHVAIVSLHALTLLTVLTVLVEADLVRAHVGGDRPGPLATALTTARRTVVHPVVLPVLAGLAWNLLSLPLGGPFDEILRTLGQAVVPVCLVTIGLSLHQYGVVGVAGPAVALSVGKLAVQPALVLVAAHWGAGLTGVPLAVVVLAASLPIGSNALLFAQRYRAREAEATAGIVLSTLAFVVTGPLWLLVLARF
ncbi:MAG: AEC family transporter [Actinobacteria bacterium]|nr:AEC family transporter [Actinomycetota bacterium]